MPKLFFPEGMGVYKIVVEIPEGWGDYFTGQKMEIPGRGGGAYVKFPPWWGYGYFLELHILKSKFLCKVSTNKLNLIL